MGGGLIYAGLTRITIDLQIYAFYKAIPSFYVYYCKFSFCILYFSLSLCRLLFVFRIDFNSIL